jgi:hypothetical protein
VGEVERRDPVNEDEYQCSQKEQATGRDRAASAVPWHRIGRDCRHGDLQVAGSAVHRSSVVRLFDATPVVVVIAPDIVELRRGYFDESDVGECGDTVLAADHDRVGVAG